MWKILITFAVLSVGAIVAQEFCVQCESTIDNSDCVNHENFQTLARECEGANNGSCFTRVTADGHIHRGCGFQINDTQCTGELCLTCQLISGGSTACNDIVFPINRLTCYNCSGAENTSCATLNHNTTDLHPVTCPIFRADDRCFATRRNGIAQRGCLSSMANNFCEGGRCNVCQGHNCNHFLWADLNSAFSVSSSLKLIAFAIISLLFMRN